MEPKGTMGKWLIVFADDDYSIVSNYEQGLRMFSRHARALVIRSFHSVEEFLGGVRRRQREGKSWKK